MEDNFGKELEQHGIEEKNKCLPDFENIISFEDIDEFINNVNLKKEVKIEHFNIYKKIKKENLISPLIMLLINLTIR